MRQQEIPIFRDGTIKEATMYQETINMDESGAQEQQTTLCKELEPYRNIIEWKATAKDYKTGKME